MALPPFPQTYADAVCKILLVDDDEEDYMLAREMLKEAKGRKFDLHWVPTYDQGLEQALHGDFCAMLVDYDLGGRRTGIELIRAVCEAGCPFPLILYTGRGTFEVDLEAMQAGATLYITKNEANPLLLERAIRYAMEIKHKEQALIHRESALRETTEALQRSEEKFAKSFRGSPVAIAISTVADGRFMEVNDSYLELFEFPCEEMIGHTSIELGMFPDPSERAKVRDAFRESGGFRDYELRLLTKTGRVKDVLFSTEAIEIDGVECMLSIVVDITQRNQAVESLRASQEALRQNEERLREVLETTHDSFFILDREWRFLYINKRAAELLNRSAEELTGKVFWEEFPRYIGTEAESHYRKVMEERVPVQFPHGGVYTNSFYEVSIYPTRDGIAVSGANRTEERKAQEALRQLSEAVKQSPATVVITDPNGQIEYVNPKFTQLTGYTFEEALGQKPNILQSGQTPREVYNNLWKTILDGKTWRGEFANRKKNGEIYWESVSISPINNENGAITHFVAVKEDVTERKRAEEALAESARQLERSNRELEQFAFVASHDLQEPLRKIRMFSDSLMKQKSGLPEESRDYLERMSRAAERMQQMVDGLLELSRVSTRKRDFTRVHLKRLAEEALSDLEPRVQATGGQVIIGDLPWVEGDAMQLRQLFQNMIGNALKFHKNGEQPVIRVSGEVINDGSRLVAALRVTDNGIGFEQQYEDRIFQPFQRLHGRVEYEGTGLGLAIVNKIVERHGGMIKVESVPGEGATFTICLPVKAVA